MRSNRIMWGFVSLVVLITIAVTFGPLDSHSQQKTQPGPTPQNNGYDDLSKYAIVDYDAPEPENAKAREDRRLKSQRYDGQLWVHKNPHPDTSGVGRHDEIAPPPAIPAAESDLIVVGGITSVIAYLSNDKKAVYSEFTVCVDEILKEDISNKIVKGASITADRDGGFILYPSGQKVLYLDSSKDLPGVGSKYIFFLTSDRKSPNYKILTGYELKESSFIPLDRQLDLGDLTGTNRQNFMKAVRTKVSQSLTTPNEKEKHQ